VFGYSHSGIGLHGSTGTGYAAYLDGRVYIRGPLQKPGGSFKIDHPLDPANKYLYHSFVESPDTKNIYDGVVALDDKGEAEIELPYWFGALNKDFRYQLTAIGAPGPNLYIAEEISDDVMNESNNSSNNNNNRNNRFKIAGGTPGMKVSWHVTGIRKDPWANAHRIQVEEDKPDKECGYYMYPELYGQPAENGISHLFFPEEEQERLISENKRPKKNAILTSVSDDILEDRILLHFFEMSLPGCRVFADWANPEFLRSLKSRIVGEEPDYMRMTKALKSNCPGQDEDTLVMNNMFVIPTYFNRKEKEMLAHVKRLIEYGNGSIAINPQFSKLIILLRTATEDGKGGLDKKATSHSDVFDAFRMSLQYWTSD
jgi:hypothetical protein